MQNFATSRIGVSEKISVGQVAGRLRLVVSEIGMICSPGSSQSPSALKSTQLRDAAAPVTLTSIGVETPWFRIAGGLVIAGEDHAILVVRLDQHRCASGFNVSRLDRDLRDSPRTMASTIEADEVGSVGRIAKLVFVEHSSVDVKLERRRGHAGVNRDRVAIPHQRIDRSRSDHDLGRSRPRATCRTVRPWSAMPMVKSSPSAELRAHHPDRRRWNCPGTIRRPPRDAGRCWHWSSGSDRRSG